MPPWENLVKNQLNVFGKKMDFLEIRELILLLKKANFLVNTLVYVNNGSANPVKGGHAIYLEYVILAQILPVANPPSNIDLNNDKYLDNEVLIFTPLCNTENGLYRGLRKRLANIILRGDLNETFF